MEHNATPVKSGASGKVYHRYQAPAVEPSKFKTLAHLSIIAIASFVCMAIVKSILG